MADSLHRRSSARLLIANVGVAFAGLVSTSTTAWVFGVGREAAIFLAAWSLISVIDKIFQAGQIAELAVPAYHRDIALHGQLEAQRRFAVLINTTILAVGVVAAILVLAARPMGRLLLPGLSGESLNLALSVLSYTLPILPLFVIGGLLQSLGNARGLYGRFEAWIALGSLSGSATVLCLNSCLGIWSLVFSAWVVQLVAIIGRIRHLHLDGYRHHWAFRLPGYSPLTLLRELAYTSIYVAATQIYLLGFNAALTFLPAPAYAAFRYGDLLFTRTSSLFLRPISTVFYTEYSRQLANGTAKARDTLRNALAHFSDMWAIYSTFLLLGAYPLMAMVWGGDKFGSSEIKLAALVFSIQVVAVLFRASGSLFRKHNLAHGAVRRQYLGNVITQLMSAALAPLLVGSFGFHGAIAVLAVNMVLMSIADAVVAGRLGARPLDIIPWGRIIRWSALIATSLISARIVIDLPVPEVLDAASKVHLAMASALQLGAAAAVLFIGALWIGHGNLLYLTGVSRQP